MLPDTASCLAARVERDERLSGVVFVGDGSRFCVPHCPRRVPARARLKFFGSCAAALAAQLMPCDRCAPLSAPPLPEWRLTSQLLVRACRLIRGGYLDKHSVSALASTLGVSSSELRSAFLADLGATTRAVARAHAQVIQAQIKRAAGAPRLEFKLAVREPYDADWVFSFLDKRSLPGLEEVTDGCYRRRLSGLPGDQPHWLSVRYVDGKPGQHAYLLVTLPRSARARSAELLARVARVFDTGADPRAIDSALGAEPWLKSRVTGGIRVPGAWDGFETAVRAILGQQVSVARARNLAIDLMQRFGSGDFPAPVDLVEADVSAIGMPGKRGEAVRQLSAAVLSGRLLLESHADAQDQFEALCALPGIGPWTAGYVAMRIACDSNAFPRGDWVILKQLAMTATASEKFSQAWAPWRAYALMYIWQASQN